MKGCFYKAGKNWEEEMEMMQGHPEVYGLSLQYWPYKASVEWVTCYIATHAERGSRLLDLMCGPGHLLGNIAQKRPDLQLLGIDIDAENIMCGRRLYPHISFDRGDILQWQCPLLFNVVLCTGALHHIPYEQQEIAIIKIAKAMETNGVAIISDCYVDPYKNETERRVAAAKLGYEYLRFALQKEAPDDVIKETLAILGNDVLRSEYKMSYEERKRVLERHFCGIRTIQTWPGGSLGGYGDYIHMCNVQTRSGRSF